MYKVALIGFGRSGGRFLRALIYLQRNFGYLKLEAVCDYDKGRLRKLKKYGIKSYACIDRLLEKDDYDIFVVTTNEDSHFDILCKIKEKSKKCKKILIEKLLVENIIQANKLRDIYNEGDISVHFVERHSIVVEKLKKWMKDKGVMVSRASFFWGKYRLHDYRPTVGVVSEISHPLDLVLALADINHNEKFEILKGNYISSDYSFFKPKLIDTISVNIKFGENLIVDGNSSFLWDRRERRVILFLSDNNKVRYMASIVFDTPQWDIDNCIISSVGIDCGKKSQMKKITSQQKDVESDILCISKTVKFIQENINEIETGKISNNLVHLSQGVYIQKIIDALERDSLKNTIETRIFNAKVPHKERAHDCDPLIFAYLDGNLTNEDAVNWDKEF